MKVTNYCTFFWSLPSFRTPCVCEHVSVGADGAVGIYGRPCAGEVTFCFRFLAASSSLFFHPTTTTTSGPDGSTAEGPHTGACPQPGSQVKTTFLFSCTHTHKHTLTLAKMWLLSSSAGSGCSWGTFAPSAGLRTDFTGCLPVHPRALSAVQPPCVPPPSSFLLPSAASQKAVEWCVDSHSLSCQKIAYGPKHCQRRWILTFHRVCGSFSVWPSALVHWFTHNIINFVRHGVEVTRLCQRYECKEPQIRFKLLKTHLKPNRWYS